MIEMLRNRMQGGGIKIILWLTLLSFAAGSLLTFFNYTSRYKPDSIGTVNDQEIGAGEFKRKFVQAQRMIQEVKQMYGPHADMVLKMWGLDKKPQEFVIEGLIAEKAILSGANKLGTSVSNEYVQAKLRDALFVQEYLGHLVPPQAVVKGNLDVALLKDHLQRTGITEDQFEEELTEAMQRALFLRLIEGSVYIPRAELRKAYEQEFLKKKVAIFGLPFDEYLKKAKAEKVTDAGLEAYFNAHKEQYRIPEKRSARFWSFDPESWGITLTAAEIESAYHKRKRAYVEKPEERDVQHILLKFTDASKVEVRRKAQELLKEVKARPDTFEAVANKHSQATEKGSKVSIKRGSKDVLFASTAFGLELNEISPVMETAEGFEIIKLVGKRDPVYKSLDKIRDPLVKSLKQDKFATEFNAGAQRVVRQATDMPEVVATFVAEKKGQPSMLENLQRDPSPKSQKLFSLSRVGDRAFYLDGGKGFIIELTALTPSALPQLATVKEKLTNDRANEKARSALEAELAAVATAVKGGKETLQDAAKRLKGTYEQTDWLDPQKKESLKKIDQLKIPLEKVMGLSQGQALVTEVTPQRGFVIKLQEVEPFNLKEFNEKKASLEHELFKQESASLVPAFMQALRTHAKVKMNDDFMRQVA